MLEIYVQAVLDERRFRARGDDFRHKFHIFSCNTPLRKYYIAGKQKISFVNCRTQQSRNFIQQTQPKQLILRKFRIACKRRIHFFFSIRRFARLITAERSVAVMLRNALIKARDEIWFRKIVAVKEYDVFSTRSREACVARRRYASVFIVTEHSVRNAGTFQYSLRTVR